METPRYFDDWEEFKLWCWWWGFIQKWINEELPMGYHFGEAFDVMKNCLIYAVTFKPWNPWEHKEIHKKFEYSNGTMKVS